MTWLESDEADMVEIEIEREDVHDRKKWGKNVMKRMSTAPIDTAVELSQRFW